MVKEIKYSFWILPLMLILAVITNGNSVAKVYLDINSPAFQKFPVALCDFKDSEKEQYRLEGLSRWFSDSLAKYLNFTGIFRVVDRSAFLENQEQAGLTAEEINFADWAAIGAEFLVKGAFTSSRENELTVEFRLFDVIERKLLVGKKYWGKTEDKEIMVIRFADEILRVLTGGEGVFDTKLAFVGKKGNKSDIYTIGFGRNTIFRVTDTNSLALLPQWSPDGGTISYTSYRHNNPDLFLRDLSSGEVRPLSRLKGLNLSAPWSPDGKQKLIVLGKDGNEDIYVMDLLHNNLNRLTTDPSIEVGPVWSPDGKNIAFVSNRSGSPQIFIMDADGKNVRRLTLKGNYNTSPRWSPAGKIAFEGWVGGCFQIFAIDEDGSNLQQLTYEPEGAEAPCWSPDGRYLAFASKKNGFPVICVVNFNGTDKRVLYVATDMDSLGSLAWSPHLSVY